MTVAEALIIQKEFIANKYHIFKYQNKTLKESMKVLTKAYDELYSFLEKEHEDIIDEFIKHLIKEDEKILIKEVRRC